jgi:hypothetical protein
LIENYPCHSKEELETRERYWIDLYENLCVNIVVPTRTVKEMYALNINSYADKHKNRNKAWYKLNTEEIRKRAENYREKNYEKIQDKKKQYAEQNREKVALRRSRRGTCECGIDICIDSKARHCRSLTHINLMKQKEQEKQMMIIKIPNKIVLKQTQDIISK